MPCKVGGGVQEGWDTAPYAGSPHAGLERTEGWGEPGKVHSESDMSTGLWGHQAGV